jgi:hypothetical protein
MALPLRVVDPKGLPAEREWPKRWTLVWPNPAEIEPQQEDALPAALHWLEPFPNEINNIDPQSGSTECLTRERAIELIRDTARRFNQALYLAESAPRFKHMVEELDKLEASATQLAEDLESLNDFTRIELRRVGSDPEHHPEYNALMWAADTASLPPPAPDDLNVALPWTTRLAGLKTLVKTTRNNILERRAYMRGQDGDEGGNTNIFLEELGAPRWGLVFDCLEIFEKFRPGEATGTIGGPLYEFINCVFEYATGHPSPDHAKIDRWFKDLVVPHRLESRRHARFLALEKEEEAIFERDPQLRDPENEKRIQQINRKLNDGIKPAAELGQQLFRHTAGTKPGQKKPRKSP